MKDTALQTTFETSATTARLAPEYEHERLEIAPQGCDLATAAETHVQGATAPRRRNRKRPKTPRVAIGLTAREYHVLLVLNSFGWCTAEMITQVANLHGTLWEHGSNFVYQHLRKLRGYGFVICRKLVDGTNGLGYAVSEDGLMYVKAHKDSLLCDTNAAKDPASMEHFLRVNQIMLQFIKAFPTRFWLSDFQVRSDNIRYGKSGFAKDYDSVAEFQLQSGPVRLAVEYDRSQRSATRYAQLSNTLAAEKQLHMVLIFVDNQKLLLTISQHLKRLTGLVCFLDRSQFISQGVDCPTFYWYNDELRNAPLRHLMVGVSSRPKPEYTPFHRLSLRIKQ